MTTHHLLSADQAERATTLLACIEARDPYTFEPVFSHGDIGLCHLICDPAGEFADILRLLGVEMAEACLERYRHPMDAGFWDRIHRFPLNLIFDELVHGLEMRAEAEIAGALARLDLVLDQTEVWFPG